MSEKKTAQEIVAEHREALEETRRVREETRGKSKARALNAVDMQDGLAELAGDIYARQRESKSK